MRNLTMAIAMLAAVGLLSACGEQAGAETTLDPQNPTAKQSTTDKQEETKVDEQVATGDKLMLKVEGMMCVNCQAHVTEILEGMDSVADAEVNHETGEAIVTLKKDADFNEPAAKAALDKDMYKLTDCEKYTPPTS